MAHRRQPRVPKTRGAQALAEWIERERRSQAWVAEQISRERETVHQTTISLWIGHVIPPAHFAARLEELCGIPVGWWDQPPPPDSADSIVADSEPHRSSA